MKNVENGVETTPAARQLKKTIVQQQHNVKTLHDKIR